MHPLFREQVIEARTTSWMGTVRLRSTWRMYGAAAGAVALVILLVVVAAFGSFTRKAHLPGVIVPGAGALVMQAPAAGIVTDLRVSEGQRVSAGDLLLNIDTERLSSVGTGIRKTNAEIAQIIRARLGSLRQQRESHQQNFNERELAASQRIRLLDEQVSQAAAEEGLLARRLQLAEESLKRHEALALRGYISQAQVQSKFEELLDAKSRLQSSKRAMLSLRSDRNAADLDRASAANQLSLQFAEVSHSEELAQQELVEAEARGKAAVTAPIGGTIAATDLTTGLAVHAGQNLLTIIPTAGTDRRGQEIVAHLYATSRSAGFVREGQVVRLRIDAFPFQKFGFVTGRVRNVSQAPFALADLPPNVSQQLASRNGTRESGLFRLVVDLDHGRRADEVRLKPGDTLEADVSVERRAIWEWMFEPLLRMRRWL